MIRWRGGVEGEEVETHRCWGGWESSSRWPLWRAAETNTGCSLTGWSGHTETKWCRPATQHPSHIPPHWRVNTQATSKEIESVCDWLLQQWDPNTYANTKSLCLYLLQAGRVQLSFVDDLDGDLQQKRKITLKLQIRCLCFVATRIRSESFLSRDKVTSFAGFGGATEAERTPGGEILMTWQHLWWYI